MKRMIGIIALVGLTGLAACGADAPPFTPTASTGISIGTGGVATSTTLGGTSGRVSGGVTLGGRY